MTSRLRKALPGLLVVSSLAGLSAAAEIDFTRDVEPILHKRCYGCHGPAQSMSGLRLDRKEYALKGGYSGPVIVPGDSARSPLVQRVTSDKQGFRMPPIGSVLSAAELAALRAWVDAGAVWAEREPVPERTSEEKIGHWAFRPVKRPQAPEVAQNSWAKNAIDRFVLARLEKEGVQPSPEADKVTLARRVYLDLIGLPPSPEDIDRFLGDDRPDAYERLVEELLQSPQYGEKQALPWLDAARYADSDGYERDPLRPHAWRWRNWVINAMNQDVPFDRFTIEQLAGDQLPKATLEQRVATGFLRNGVKNREAGVKNEEKRFEELLDRVNTVGTVWLGLTVGCAQCHDHKYDPLTQKELYQLFAVFNNAVERDIEAPVPGQFGPFLRSWPEYRKKRDQLLDDDGVHPLFAKWRERMLQTMDRPGVNTDWDHSVTEWRAANDRADWLMRSPDDALSEIERDKRMDWFLRSSGPDFAKDEVIAGKLKKVREELDKAERELLPSRTLGYTMVERDEPETTYIALRGDWRAQGLAVKPDIPAILGKLEEQEKRPRLQFARWLVGKDNPLTARVAVNRIWQQFFGRGLVRTADDFGTQGDRPSHPDLLDWLASTFVERGWSRKALIRFIVTSATYRQSSHGRPDTASRDPDNAWLARQNRLRLPAETIRDSALAASGLLNPEVGGQSAFPPQPEGVSDLSYSKKNWPEDTGPQRYRRGLYISFRRTSPYPFLMNFDSPGKLTAAVRRETSNTPLQALNLLNDPVFIEAAQALAVRVAMEEREFRGRLERMFRLCLARAPGGAERDRIATYFDRQKEMFRSRSEAAEQVAPFVPPGEERAEVAAWVAVARGLMNLDEFVTRE